MDLYLLNLLVICFYRLIIRVLGFKKDKERVCFVVLAFIHITIFHALRDPYIFPDNTGYSEAFVEISQMSFHEAAFELTPYSVWGQGYVLLNWLLSRISNDPSILFVGTSIIMVSGIMWFIYKCSYSPLMSICAFFLYASLMFQSFYAIRQHIAATFLLLALLYIQNLKKSIPLCILAILFHASAVVFVPFYFFYYCKWKYKVKSLIIVGGLILVVLHFGVNFMMQNYERYGAYEDRTGNNTLPLLVMISLLFMHLYNRSFRYCNDEKDRIMLKFLVYASFMLLGLLGSPGGRLSCYFVYPMIVILPLLLKCNNRIISIKKLFVSVYFVALLFLWHLLTKNALFVEYQLNNSLLF